MSRQASIRLFLPTGGTPGQKSWTGVAQNCVRALSDHGMTWNLLLFAFPFANFDKQSPWYEYRELFVGNLAERFVNIVVGVNPIQKGFVLSGTREQQQAAVKAREGRELNDKDLADLKDIVPEPELVRFFTVGVPNMAVVGGWPRKLETEEVRALRRYDIVVAPTAADLHGLPDLDNLRVATGFAFVAAVTDLVAKL
jgi:hypothetical protein